MHLRRAADLNIKIEHARNQLSAESAGMKK